MKRIIVVLAASLMALVTALSLVACKIEQPQEPANNEAPIEQKTEKKDDAAFALWQTANQYSEEANALAFFMDFEMDMRSESSPTPIAISMSGPVSMINTSDPNKLEMALDLQMDMLGQELPMQAWYRDGYYYFDMLGMKAKQSMSGEEAIQQNNAELLSFTENAIKEQSITDTADGGKKLSFLLDGAKMTALARDSMSMGGQGDVDPSMLSIKMDDVEVTVTLDKDGKLAECTYTFSASIADADAGETISMECTTSMNNITSEDVEIVFPDDLESYQETPAAIKTT
ncbi:MAG: hypothetical protein LBP24_02765 [Coriobacteriales bacterium]|nr:hypothetical protein [Coriobacteriales bacterium]